MGRLVNRLGWPLAVVAAAVGGAVLVNIWSTPDGAGHDPVDSAASTGGTVEVVRRDITVVLAIDATTTPLPSFTVAVPERDVVDRAVELDPGDEVAAGEALFVTGSDLVSSPVPALFEEWLVPDGVEVSAGVPVVRLRYPGFGMVAALPPTDAYRLLAGELTATASIDRGPAGFGCEILLAPSANAGADLVPDVGSMPPGVVCAVPADVRAFADLPGRIALESGQVTDVLTLPVTAVLGGADSGEVSLVADDGTVTIRSVELGATDGAAVEITSGLREGDRVLAYPPPLVR